MGRAMVGNLVIAGAQLTVWNRTPGVVTPSASLRVAERAGHIPDFGAPTMKKFGRAILVSCSRSGFV